MIETSIVYTVDSLAEALNRSTKTIRRWIRDGLPARKVGGTYLISGKDIEAWIDRRN